MFSLSSRLRSIAQKADQALSLDRQAAFEEIQRIRHAIKQGAAPEGLVLRLERLDRQLDASAAVLELRRQPLGDLGIDAQLPIAAKKDELISAIAAHQVLIVSGETGSGKTTQIPKLCLLAGRGTTGCIGVTQPRRIAAISVCRRIAQELGEQPAATVGYKIRFKDTTHSQARIKIMTDGVLLAEAHRDPRLYQYDTIMVDEAHERSLNIDFILGILKKLIRQRSDLKLIISSATIDTDKFAAAFDNAPVVEVSGRLFPVQIRYAPSTGSGDEELSPVEQAVQAADRLIREKQRGDILIFMPTERDIRDTCGLLEGRRPAETRVVPLFARLSADEQQKVFQPFAGRTIVVATNVAETSITIPGIRYVIDTGLARVAQYTPRSRTTTLPVVPISRSSADQRSGRCGRVADGICIRLYSEEDYNQRPRFTPPEILRASLAEVILRMIALKLGEVAAFPFIDPPVPRSIRDGYNLLTELGAIQKSARTADQGQYRLTAKGRLMARLPLDPRLSCMLLEAHQCGCLNDVVVIAAALSIQDPRERPLEKQQAADSAHAALADPMSDFITLLRIWHAFVRMVDSRSSWNQVKQFCRTRFLSFARLREWRDIHMQLHQILAEHGIRSDRPTIDPDPPGDLKNSSYADIHRCVLAGFLSNIATRKEKQLFMAAHHRQVMIFPGSGLFKNPGNWIVAAEMVETSRPFARCAAVIDPRWIEPLAQDQCAYAYLDPHWEKKRGAVMVTEQVSLYGLVIDRRLKPFGPVDPEQACGIFIRHAMIEGDIRNPPAFILENRRKVSAVEDMEHRLRRRDLLVEELVLEAFYRERLGDVFDLRTLQKTIRRRGGDHFLHMQAEDLLNYFPSAEELALYPEHIESGAQRLACSYQFNPGHEDDGVTVSVPLDAIGAVNPESLQWLVPGLLKAKIAALIKALPKEWRKQLVPIAETADIIADEMPAQRDTRLAMALSRFIERRFKAKIPVSAWDETLLADHLRMRIAITDSHGRTVQSGRDPRILKQSPDQALSDLFLSARRRYERFPVEAWDFGDLPESIALAGPQDVQWTAYPALEARGDQVALCAMADRSVARKTHPGGVRALFCLRFSQDVKYLRKNLQLPAHCEPAARYFGGRKFLEERLHARVLSDLLAVDIRTADAFAAMAADIGKNGLAAQGQATKQALLDLLSIYQQTRLTLHDLERVHAGRAAILNFLARLRGRLENLVPANFLDLYDRTQLNHIGRYLKALAIRAERGVIEPEKDRRRAEQVIPYERRLSELARSLGPADDPARHRAVEALFWMIEEYQISLFAQEIKTAGPISAKRLDKQLAVIEETR